MAPHRGCPGTALRPRDGHEWGPGFGRRPRGGGARDVHRPGRRAAGDGDRPCPGSGRACAAGPGGDVVAATGGEEASGPATDSRFPHGSGDLSDAEFLAAMEHHEEKDLGLQSCDGVSATVKGGVGKFRERPRAALQEERDVAGPVPAHAAPRHPRRRHRQDPGQHAPQAQQHGEDDRALPACRALRLCRLPEPGREPARLRTVRRLGQAAARRVSSRTSSRSGEAGGHPQMLWAVDLIERPEPGPSHQAWRRRPGRRQVDLGRRDRRRDRARRPRGVHHVPAQDVPLRSAHAPRPGPLEPAYAAGARSFDHWPNPQAIPPAASRPLSSARSTNFATLSALGCSTRPGARSTSSP